MNGKIRQNTDLDQMIWTVAEQIAQLSAAFELAPGDVMEGHIDGLPTLNLKVVLPGHLREGR